MGQTKSYQELREELSNLTLGLLQQFARENGLREPTTKNLEQMSINHETAMNEIMWFGFDKWPPGTNDDSGKAPPPPPPNKECLISALLTRLTSSQPVLSHVMARIASRLSIGIVMPTTPMA